MLIVPDLHEIRAVGFQFGMYQQHRRTHFARHAPAFDQPRAGERNDDADDDHRQPNVERHESEAHADRDCVDAAGHGERQHVLPIEFRGFLGVLLVLFERLAYHIAAD